MLIRASNRVLPLTIPIQRRGQRMPIRDKKISYAENWQKQHWGSLQAAFRNSPYFEYYEDQLSLFYQRKYEFLLDLNLAILEVIWQWLGLEGKIRFSQEYFPTTHYQLDLRLAFDPSGKTIPDWFRAVPYTQVFEGFVPGLSILDLLCNLGPESRKILQMGWGTQLA